MASPLTPFQPHSQRSPPFPPNHASVSTQIQDFSSSLRFHCHILGGIFPPRHGWHPGNLSLPPLHVLKLLSCFPPTAFHDFCLSREKWQTLDSSSLFLDIPTECRSALQTLQDPSRISAPAIPRCSKCPTWPWTRPGVPAMDYLG